MSVGSSSPLYNEIYESLKGKILSGHYTPGDSLPSEPKLKLEYGVSTITIRRAIRELCLDGLVESRQGMGNFVRDSSTGSVVVGMSSFTSDVVGGRLRLIRSLLTDEMTTAPVDIANQLNVPVGSMLRRLVRLDYEGNTPLSLDEVYIPPDIGSCINHEIAGSPVFMHLWQKESGLELVSTQYQIWTETASEMDIQYLKMQPECPVLITTELVYDINSRACAWIISRYRGDRGRLSGTVMLVQNRSDIKVIGE